MFFIVILTHPDGPAWGKHVKAHVDYLKERIAEGEVLAAGQALGGPLRQGAYIATVSSRADAERLVADDPFTPEGVVLSSEIIEWKPFFGIFAGQVETPSL